MAASGSQIRPPQSPFEVDLITSKIFSYLTYPDLAECRLVSKFWDQEASKLVWKKSTVSKIKCRLIPTEEDLHWFLENSSQVFSMEQDQDFLDLVQRRVSSSQDSLFSFKFDSAVAETLIKQKVYFARYPDPARAICGFLVDPSLCDLVGHVDLERLFADMNVILQLLTELPNLKSFSVDFDVATFVRTRSVVPKCYKTSPVQKLNLQLVRHIFEPTPILKDSFWECARNILEICVNLKDLTFVDRASGENTEPLDMNFVRKSLKNPMRLEKLWLQSYHLYVFADIGAIQQINFLPNTKSLNLMDWARLPLDTWKYIIAHQLPHTLQDLSLRIIHNKCPRQLVYHELMSAGLGRFRNLKNLVIKFYPGKSATAMQDWYEEWTLVEGKLELVEARIVYDGSSKIDLRPWKHLHDLTIRVYKTTLTDALRFAPPTVKQLEVTTVTKTSRFSMSDDDFRRDGALKALQSLEILRIRHQCDQCTEAILQYVFAEMENLSYVGLPYLKFGKNLLELYGVEGITFGQF